MGTELLNELLLNVILSGAIAKSKNLGLGACPSKIKKATTMYYVYILTNRNRKVLYTGVTNNVLRRVYEHKEAELNSFTARYKAYTLVYCEEYGNVEEAISREKQLKGWRHNKKVALIEQQNPSWADLLKQ